MTTFTPPVSPGIARADPSSDDPADRLFRFYAPHDTGETVWQDQAGVWHQTQYPYHGGDTSTVHNDDVTTVTSPVEGLATAQKVYLGGHIHDISASEEAALIAAGYASRINIAPVKGTWTSEQMSKFSSKYLLTADGSHATPALPFLTDGNKLGVQLSAGTSLGQSQLREFFLHSDTAGWTDCRGVIEIDPPVYALNFGGDPNADIIPQMGVCLRAQFNSMSGKNQGITLNNGTFLGLPMLNIGAWHAFPDGSGFQNRQFSWPFEQFFADGYALPYGWEWELIGNIIRVRTYKVTPGQSPDSVSWDDPIHSRTLDLDVDCGSIATVPTPVGPGTNGIISAHLGIHPLSMVRIRRFEMERIS